MKNILIFAIVVILFFSPDIWRFTRIRIGCALERHWHLNARDFVADPPSNDMRLEIIVRNKFTHNWINASAGIVLLRPDEYDLWMPK